MVKTKDRKKMYKSGKFWVAAGLTAATVGGVATVEPEIWYEIGHEIHEVLAAPVVSTTTIDQVTDVNANRTVNWAASDVKTHGEYAGAGKYDSTTNWSAEASSVTDPAGQTYAKLTANVNNTSGYYYLNRQFDTSKSFTITGYFKASTSTSTQNLQPDGKWSDWVGLVLTPTDPSTMASDYKFDTYGGGGLGIQGFSNAVALGLDFYGSNSGDPAAGPFGSLRRTDASGNLIAMNKSNTTDQKLFTNGINMTTWNSVVKYTITWNPTGNNGQPSISGQLSSTNNAGSWSFDTASAVVAVANPGALSIAVNATKMTILLPSTQLRVRLHQV